MSTGARTNPRRTCSNRSGRERRPGDSWWGTERHGGASVAGVRRREEGYPWAGPREVGWISNRDQAELALAEPVAPDSPRVGVVCGRARDQREVDFEDRGETRRNRLVRGVRPVRYGDFAHAASIQALLRGGRLVGRLSNLNPAPRVDANALPSASQQHAADRRQGGNHCLERRARHHHAMPILPEQAGVIQERDRARIALDPALSHEARLGREVVLEVERGRVQIANTSGLVTHDPKRVHRPRRDRGGLPRCQFVPVGADEHLERPFDHLIGLGLLGMYVARHVLRRRRKEHLELEHLTTRIRSALHHRELTSVVKAQDVAGSDRHRFPSYAAEYNAVLPACTQRKQPSNGTSGTVIEPSSPPPGLNA